MLQHYRTIEQMFEHACVVFITVFMEYKLLPLVKYDILGDPEVTANIYCKSRNPPNMDTQNYSTDLR